MQSFTLLSNYFRFSKMRSLSIPGMFGGNGSATIVCFEKKPPKLKLTRLSFILAASFRVHVQLLCCN